MHNAQDLKLSETTIVQAKTLQTQQSTEIDRLKVALVKETTNVEKEYNAKLEVSKERLMERDSIVGREVVDQWDN